MAQPDPSELAESYEVVILRFEPRAEPPALGLQRMFGLERAAAEALLRELPRTVRRGVNRPRAEYFRRALVSIGAHVEIRNALGETVASASPQPMALAEQPRARAAQPVLDAQASQPLAARSGDAQASQPRSRPVRTSPPAVGSPPVVCSPTSQLPPARAPIARTLVHGTTPPTAADEQGSPARPSARTELAPLWLRAEDSPAARTAARSRFAQARSPELGESSGLGLDMDEARWDRLELTAEEPGVAESFTPPGAQSLSSARSPAPSSARPNTTRSQDEALPLLERWQLPGPSDFATSSKAAPISQRAIASVLTSASPLPRSAAAPSGRASAVERGAGSSTDGSGPAVARGAGFSADGRVGPRASAGRGKEAAAVGDTAARATAADTSGLEHGAARSSAEMRTHVTDSGANASDGRDRTSSARAPAAVRGSSAERNSPRAAVAWHAGAAAAAHSPRSFWECVPEAVQFPWLGRGRAWLFSISVWALVTNLVAAWLSSPVLSSSLALIANAGLLALCADYHRRCMWSAVAEADGINQSPQLASARGYDFYLRSGAHIACFGLISQLPIVVWLVRRTLDSGPAGTREVLGAPAFWLLAALPGLYWPMAVATASHANRFAGVWHVWVGMRAIVRAPLEYAVNVGLGALSFALPWLACVIVGKIAGVPAQYFAALAGLPLGMSHAVMGTLTGLLLRTRPEVFE